MAYISNVSHNQADIEPPRKVENVNITYTQVKYVDTSDQADQNINKYHIFIR